MDSTTITNIATEDPKEAPKEAPKKEYIPTVKTIHESCENPQLVNANFKKCVKGYHLVNSSPINETIWEDINATIFTSLGIAVYSKSDGSHLSGMDMDTSIGRISNKSAKYQKQKISISSYRLTTVCSEKNCGNITEIIQEINRRKNFDYYSIMLRDETHAETIKYDWLLIPSNYPTLDPDSYTWEPKYGKKEKKDVQTGWHTNEINGCSMSITFTMSSQLWMHFVITEEVEKFIVASTVVNKNAKYNYIELLEKLEKNI